jgi:hypothetical protein
MSGMIRDEFHRFTADLHDLFCFHLVRPFIDFDRIMATSTGHSATP